MRVQRKGSHLSVGDHAACRIRSDRKSTRLNSSHLVISYAVFCLKKKKKNVNCDDAYIQTVEDVINDLLHHCATKKQPPTASNSTRLSPPPVRASVLELTVSSTCQ